MLRTILSLGKTPLIRRIIAGVILLTIAILSSLLRTDGAFLSIDLASNIAVALAALGLLHLRWRRQEKRALTAEKIEDTFS